MAKTKIKKITYQHDLVKVKDVVLGGDNPRLGNVSKIKESILENGFITPIVVQKSTNKVLAGNHRVMAASELNYEEIPAYIVDLDDIEAKKFMLADNKASDEAIYDEDKLADMLKDLNSVADLKGTGYARKEADVIIARAEWQQEDEEEMIIEEYGAEIDDDGLETEGSITKIKRKEERLAEREKVLEEIGRRTIYLSIPLKEGRFDVIQDALESARGAYDVGTNEECLVELLREAGHIDSDFRLLDKE